MPLSYKPITKKEKIFIPTSFWFSVSYFITLRGTGNDFFLNVNQKKWIDCNLCKGIKVSMDLQSKEIQCGR